MSFINLTFISLNLTYRPLNEAKRDKISKYPDLHALLSAGPSLHATPSTPCNPVTWLMQPRKYPKIGKFDQKVTEIGDFRSFLRLCNPVNFGNGQNKDGPGSYYLCPDPPFRY